MVTVLNVAEKPSVARALAQVFGRMDGAQDRGMRRDVHQVSTIDNVRFPNVYSQGEGRMIHGPITPHKMITTSVRGHLAGQDFSPDRYGWNKCDPIVLFDEAPILTTYQPDMEGLKRMLEQLARTCQVLILWLDCDREGEAIGDEVREVCLESNPRLQVYRARFSTVLAPEIHKALKTLGRLNEAFVDAVKARSQIDLRVGAAFTRFQTLRLQRRFEGFGSTVVSYGPCQFPTLGFVVERWARIETFVPEDFWYIELSIQVDDALQQQQNNNNDNNDQAARQHPVQQGNSSGGGRSINFTWKRGKLYDQHLTMILYESCLDAGEAVVTKLEGRPKNRWRPVPLATVELQKRASRYLRIGSEQLMNAAEQLYQNGYISYPRTETEKFRPEFQHQPLIQQLANVPGEIGEYASKLLTNNNFQRPRNGQHDDQAHPPITPGKAVDPNTITDNKQRNVYILVVKHYLACCSRDAVGKETTLTLKMDFEEFNAKGLMILEKNWLEIYHPWERWSTGQGELPPLQVGSRIVPSSLLMKEGTTVPPQLISEVELISLMDRNGIGTDATIATHISTIQEREYAIKDAGQKFSPTPLGIALVEGYNSMGYQLNRPDLRREMEAECNDVAAGRKTKEDVIDPILAKMRQCYEKVTQEAHKLDAAVARHFSPLGSGNETNQVLQARFSECGDCRNLMVLKAGNEQANGRNASRRKLLYCNTCRKGWLLPPRGQFQAKTENGGAPVKCPICNFQVIHVRSEGNTGNGHHVCPKCYSEPPAEHGGAPNGGEFRCFNCQHPTCSLATGSPGSDVEVFACPFCHPGGTRPPNDNTGKIILRKNSSGWVLSCSNYDSRRPREENCGYTIWLPKECCRTVSVPTGDENQNTMCANCSTGGRTVRMVSFVWIPGSVPPHMGSDCTTCILCDTDFRREMNINLPNRNQVRTRPQVRRGGGRVSGGRGQGARGGRGGVAGGIVCYKCNQPGHYANSCPNARRGGS